MVVFGDKVEASLCESKPDGHHEMFQHNIFQDSNLALQDLKLFAREIGRAECAKCIDRVSRRCIPSGVALDGRWSAVGMTGACTGIGAPGIIDWFNILYDRYIRIGIAKHSMIKYITPLLRANRVSSKGTNGKQKK